MKTNQFLLTALLAISTSTCPGLRAAPGDQNATRAIMRTKLVFSRNILEGIVLEKPDLVARNARLLRDMSQTNAFLALGFSDYLRYIKQYQGNTDALAQAAREKNLTKASQIFAKISNNCVECHRSFRREQYVRRDKE